LAPSDDIEALYRRYGPMVLRRCLRLLADAAQAQDALHDVFVRAIQRGGLREAHAPAAYLHVLATNVCLNRLRAARVRGRGEEADASLLERIAFAEALEERTWAGRLLERLFAGEAASTRTLAVLHLLDGMTLEEVAREVGLSVSGVRFRLRRLREKLEGLEATS
jgi:RNA polymerase sigma factor (sigma-70 family)